MSQNSEHRIIKDRNRKGLGIPESEATSNLLSAGTSKQQVPRHARNDKSLSESARSKKRKRDETVALVRVHFFLQGF